MDDTLPTLFAPASRASSDDLARQYEAFKDYHCTEMVNSLPSLVVVLNSTRQIVFANKSLLDLVGASDVKDILGQRPGEVLGCVHAKETDGGCGTSSFCQECGAVRAILKSLDGARDAQECSMLRTDNGIFEALDLLVTAVPFSLSDESFTVFSVIDISHQNRRRALERIFFHDIMNTAGGLKGLLEMLRDEVPPHLREDVGVLHISFERMLDEIASQRELMAAESGELEVRSMMLKSMDVLLSLAGVYARHDSGRGKRLRLSPDTDEVWFDTDHTLLSRVLGNMVKNALEATGRGGLVELGCTDEGEQASFWVKNEQAMDDSTRLNVFKRSFSTKGMGRGLGTYSMKLLGERYLGGQVSFISKPGQGTVFSLRLPVRRE